MTKTTNILKDNDKPNYYIREFEHWSSPYRLYKLVRNNKGQTWYEAVEIEELSELLTKLLQTNVPVEYS